MTPNQNSLPEPDAETVAAARDWARTADFAWPLRWGQVEEAVMEQPLPRDGGGIAGAAIQGTLATISALLVGGASLIGLVLVFVLRGTNDADRQDIFGTGALFAFLIALGVVVAAAFIWWDTGRRRSPLGLAMAGATGLLSAIAFVAFQGASYPDDRNSLFIRLLTAATALVGLGLVGAILLASKQGASQRSGRRLSLGIGRELQLIDARNTVLDVLVERKLASLDVREKERIASMPLGSWHELDAPQG